MKYKLVIQDTAKLDILEAIYYYNSKQNNLGKRFFTAFKSKIKTIRSNPEGYALRYEDVRMAKIDNFPYMIHFQLDITKNSIFILAVFYEGENPEKWMKLI